MTCTATHTVTQADLDAGGSLTNIVDGGHRPGPPPATDSDSPSRPPRAPRLTLDKTITSGDPYTAVGGTIAYSYLVTNTGNVTITGLAVTDDNVETRRSAP